MRNRVLQGIVKTQMQKWRMEDYVKEQAKRFHNQQAGGGIIEWVVVAAVAAIIAVFLIDPIKNGLKDLLTYIFDELEKMFDTNTSN